MLEGWESPDVTVYLAAILGLLVVWQYYQMQIMAGRILAIDIFDRSGRRPYLCGLCRIAWLLLLTSPGGEETVFTAYREVSTAGALYWSIGRTVWCLVGSERCVGTPP